MTNDCVNRSELTSYSEAIHPCAEAVLLVWSSGLLYRHVQPFECEYPSATVVIHVQIANAFSSSLRILTSLCIHLIYTRVCCTFDALSTSRDVCKANHEGVVVISPDLMRKMSWRALEFLEMDEKSVAVMTLRGALNISIGLVA